MKITNQEIKVLINKYKSENMTRKQIENRLKEHYEIDEYIKFANKYLNRLYKI